MTKVVTRFAPSPTGFLHIGGARTALFNWLYARHSGGTFRLRIEDTDKVRSTKEAIEKIIEGLQWLGLEWDDEIVHQSARDARHAEIARTLLDSGNAYYCYASAEELQEMRDKARAEGRPMGYDGRWRDRDPSEAPEGVPPVIRLKSPTEGTTIIKDHVQGDVKFDNRNLDDLVLMRSDGTPTYMLSVVVDDHDMEITHIIRGDDHLTNAARQTQIYNALGWETPQFAHVPLIHGPDGAKFSKRHGALGVEAYRDMGYLAAAMRNYLVRLGWSHGDDEIFSTEQAITWFTLGGINRAAARFDFAKLQNLNGNYIRNTADRELLVETVRCMTTLSGLSVTDAQQDQILRAMPGLKERAKTIVELAEGAAFIVHQRPLAVDEKATKLLTDEARHVLGRLVTRLTEVSDWTHDALDQVVREFAEEEGLKLGKVAQPLRAALTGTTVSPGIFDVLEVLGREEALARLADQAIAT